MTRGQGLGCLRLFHRPVIVLRVGVTADRVSLGKNYYAVRRQEFEVTVQTLSRNVIACNSSTFVTNSSS